MSFDNFDPTKANELVAKAQAIAVKHDHEYITLEHLLSVILLEKQVSDILVELGVDIPKLNKDIDDHLTSGAMGKAFGRPPRGTINLERVIKRLVSQAMFSERKECRAIDLLIAIMNEDDPDSHACYFLAKQNLDIFDVKKAASTERVLEDIDEVGDKDAEGDQSVVNKSKSERLLDKFCRNLNEQAQAGKIDPLIGRETEVASLILTTARRTKNNVVLVGEPGVGKTAVVEGLAKMIAEGNVPDAIKGSIVYSLEMGDLMAGTKFRGDMEERVKQILESVEKLSEEKGVPIMLFIDEMHTMMGAGSGSQGSLDVANLLKPALAKGKLRCIGGTTYEEYRKHFEKDRALLRRFQRLDIVEPSVEDAKRIITGLSSVYAAYHNVSYTQEALDAAVDLTARYVTDRMLPDKAIDVIDACGARQKIAADDVRQSVITVGLVEEEVSRIAKIPTQTVKEDDTDKLLHLKHDLQKVVFGQDLAIDTVENAVLLSRSGLRPADKTQGSYLFVGPTGVGKTELTKRLAETLSMKIHRFDMSEYMEKHSISKFIGSPPGYVGFGDGAAGSGLLANAIDQDPFSVILIDEVEKAHPDIFNIFLKIMDNGAFTTSAGKTINCQNIILIMTSNAGAKELQKNSMGFGGNSVAGNDDKVIEQTFSPEFRNRLDAIVKFNNLAQEHMLLVVDKFLGNLATLAKARNVTLTFTPEANNYLAEKGYSPKYGARPLARLVQEKVSQPLSRLLLFGDLKNGGHATVTVRNGDIVIVPEYKLLESDIVEHA